MFLSHLKIALRTLLKFKSYALINLTGLTLGLTAGILIMAYVLDETSYDTFHTKAGRLSDGNHFVFYDNPKEL